MIKSVILAILLFSIPLSATANAKKTTFTKTIEQAEKAYNQKDYATAIHIYQKLADKNDSRGIHALGIMNELGQGCDRNVTNALKFYKYAAKLGNLDSYFNLGLLYQNNKDLNQSIGYYTYAADKGHVRAQHNLAHLYDESKPPYTDDKKAFYYYTLASAQGFAISEYKLANFYALGRGCERNETHAIELYKKSLLQEDNARAQYNVALMIARGLGTQQNNILAYALWDNNAALGDADSGYNRDVLKKRMEPEEIISAQELAKNRKKMIMMITPTESKKNLPKLL